MEAALDHLEARARLSRDGPGVSLARPVLESYDPALRARVIRRVLRRLGSTPDRAGTQAALEFISSGPSGGEHHVAGGVRIERDFDAIRITGDEPASRAVEEPLVILDRGPGSGQARIGGREIEVVWGPGPVAGAGRRAGLDEPVFPLTVRGWEPGDRIRLAYGSKKLKKLFGEHRLDRRARRRVPVVVDGQGRMVWAVGVARADGVDERDEHFEIAVRDAGHQHGRDGTDRGR
jgi:tRNA(Ile)-lysidine synthase